MHGSSHLEDDKPEYRPDLVDFGLLALPIVLSLLAFAFGAGIIHF